jgi:hypothetical protein
VPAFLGYFDVAGSESESDVIVACGAVSFLDDWAEFDAQRLAAMSAVGVRNFHMKDFAHFKKEYAVGWNGFENEEKRRVFLADLIRAVNENVYRIYVTTLVLSDYQKVNEEYELTERPGSPYTWVMANCLFHVFDWVLGEGGAGTDPGCPVQPSDGVGFHIEAGDSGQDGIRRLMLKLGWTEEEFRNLVYFSPKRERDEDVTPFHVPDFVAYEYRSEHRHVVVHGEKKEKPRGSLRSIRAELQPRVGIVTEETMRAACELNEVPRRKKQSEPVWPHPK